MERALQSYALVRLTCAPLGEVKVAQLARNWLDGSNINLSMIGCWKAEVGNLFNVCLLLVFHEKDGFRALTRRLAIDCMQLADCGLLKDHAIEELILFPFLDPGIVRSEGTIFEFRTYYLHPGGLLPTLSGWKEAVPIAKEYTRHLRGAFHMPTGAPRIIHIWGFDSFEQRNVLRQAHYNSGQWPPKGGPESIAKAHNALCVSLF